VIEGRKLAGLIPPLANVAARAMFAVCCEVAGPRERNVKNSGMSPVCLRKAWAQESRVRSGSVSVAQEVVGCVFGHEACSAVELYRRSVLLLDAQDMCRCEETLRVAERDKTQE
jgi:hypothetical protein